MKKIKICDRINDDVFIEVCKTSFTMAEAAKKMGIHYASLKSRAIQLNCFLPNQSGKGVKNVKSTFKYNIEDIFKYGSIIGRRSIKNRLLKENIKEYRCEKCQLTEWNNEEISLELHHIDGNPINNILENLQLLCPNCHSQTSNFGSKNINNKKEINNINDIIDINLTEINIKKCKNEKVNKVENILNICLTCGKETKRDKFCSIECYHEYQKKFFNKRNICLTCGKETKRDKFCSIECLNKYKSKDIPTKEQLIEDFNELRTKIKVGEKYNVSDNAVKKWIRKYDIGYIVNDMWKTKNKGQ